MQLFRFSVSTYKIKKHCIYIIYYIKITNIFIILKITRYICTLWFYISIFRIIVKYIVSESRESSI